LLHCCEVPTPMTAMTKQMKTKPWMPPPMRTPTSVVWVTDLRIMPRMSSDQVTVSAMAKNLKKLLGVTEDHCARTRRTAPEGRGEAHRATRVGERPCPPTREDHGAASPTGRAGRPFCSAPLPAARAQGHHDTEHDERSGRKDERQRLIAGARQVSASAVTGPGAFVSGDDLEGSGQRISAFAVDGDVVCADIGLDLRVVEAADSESGRGVLADLSGLLELLDLPVLRVDGHRRRGVGGAAGGCDLDALVADEGFGLDGLRIDAQL